MIINIKENSTFKHILFEHDLKTNSDLLAFFFIIISIE